MSGNSVGVAPDLLAGASVEVTDLQATRVFYDPIFGSVGVWETATTELTFRTPNQTVTFVQRAAPRVLTDSGQHQAYRVPPARVQAVAEALAAAGAEVHWWREDHPHERSLMPYALDPSGNHVQLLPGDTGAVLLDHVAYEVHDLIDAEDFWVRVLGGAVDFVHGRDMDDYAEAQAFLEADDPCAPWTRLILTKRAIQRAGENPPPVSRPVLQVFLRFGPTRVGLVLATDHHQEPPEEVLRGTPRAILHCGQGFAAAMAHATRASARFEYDYPSIFLRDTSGNFVELKC